MFLLLFLIKQSKSLDDEVTYIVESDMETYASDKLTKKKITFTTQPNSKRMKINLVNDIESTVEELIIDNVEISTNELNTRICIKAKRVFMFNSARFYMYQTVPKYYIDLTNVEELNIEDIQCLHCSFPPSFDKIYIEKQKFDSDHRVQIGKPFLAANYRNNFGIDGVHFYYDTSDSFYPIPIGAVHLTLIIGITLQPSFYIQTVQFLEIIKTDKYVTIDDVPITSIYTPKGTPVVIEDVPFKDEFYPIIFETTELSDLTIPCDMGILNIQITKTQAWSSPHMLSIYKINNQKADALLGLSTPIISNLEYDQSLNEFVLVAGEDSFIITDNYVNDTTRFPITQKIRLYNSSNYCCNAIKLFSPNLSKINNPDNTEIIRRLYCQDKYLMLYVNSATVEVIPDGTLALILLIVAIIICFVLLSIYAVYFIVHNLQPNTNLEDTQNPTPKVK